MRILSLFLCLLVVSCGRTFVRSYTKQSPNKPQQKIGLVGFYPYSAQFVEGGYGYRKYQAQLDYSKSMKKLLGFGTPISEIPANGVQNVPISNILRFISDYRAISNESGQQELQALFQFEGTSNTTAKLKKRDLDYYIVAIHLPPFPKTNSGILTILYDIFGSVITLWTLPFVDSFDSHSVFAVYDKNLNLIKDFSYKNSYSQWFSWWMVPDFTGFFVPSYSEPPPEKVFFRDIEQFSDDATVFFSNRNNKP